MNRIHIAVEGLKRFISDKALRFTVANIGLSAVAAPATVIFIGRFLSPSEQGLFYTFSSVLALQMLFEMGFAQSLIQFVSHEFAGFRMSDQRRLIADHDSTSLVRLATLTDISRRWYGVVAVTASVVIGVVGQIFFRHHAGAGDHWLVAWWLLCLSTGGFLLLQPSFILMEGCHEIAEVAKARFIYSVLRLAGLMTLLPFGFGLLSTGLASLVGVIVVASIVRWKWSPFFRQLLVEDTSSVSKWDIWKSEIWPLQWKISLSWISGFFIFNAFNPIILHYRGAVEAGQFGMTWMLIQGVSGVATACGSVRIAKYGTLVAKRDWKALHRLWITATMQSLVVAFGGLVLLAGGVYILSKLAPTYAVRLASVKVTVLLAVGALSNQMIFAQAFYLRAQKEEPFLWLSLIFAGGVFSCLLWLTPAFGLIGAATAYATVTVFIALPLGSWIFMRRKRRENVLLLPVIT